MMRTCVNISFYYVLLVLTSFASATDIAVIISQDLKPYQDALIGFNDIIDASISKYNMEGDINKGHNITNEIKSRKPDLILALGTKAAMIAGEDIKDIPIIYCLVSRPAKYGLMGNNITGVSLNISIETQFEAIKSVLPDKKKIGVIYDPDVSEEAVDEAKHIAMELGFVLKTFTVHSEKEIPNIMRSIEGNIDVLWMVMDETVINKNSLEYIILFSINNKIPVMGLSNRFVQKGALFSLFSDYYDLGHQAGELVEQILRGTSPNKLPVAFPQKTKLALNLKTASLIGIKISPDIIERADKIYQ